jgi:heat shock protein HspQ
MAQRAEEHKSFGNDGYSAARFGIGRVVRHRIFPFRGVIFDADPVFNNTEDGGCDSQNHARTSPTTTCSRRTTSKYIAYVSNRTSPTIPASRSGIRRSSNSSRRATAASMSRATS